MRFVSQENRLRGSAAESINTNHLGQRKTARLWLFIVVISFCASHFSNKQPTDLDQTVARVTPGAIAPEKGPSGFQSLSWPITASSSRGLVSAKLKNTQFEILLQHLFTSFYTHLNPLWFRNLFIIFNGYIFFWVVDKLFHFHENRERVC